MGTRCWPLLHLTVIGARVIGFAWVCSRSAVLGPQARAFFFLPVSWFAIGAGFYPIPRLCGGIAQALFFRSFAIGAGGKTADFRLLGVCAQPEFGPLVVGPVWRA